MAKAAKRTTSQQRALDAYEQQRQRLRREHRRLLEHQRWIAKTTRQLKYRTRVADDELITFATAIAARAGYELVKVAQSKAVNE